MLRFIDVEKRFADAPGVGPLSLEIKDKRTTVLLGESGSGKSTLIRLANGLVAPTKGEVRFADERVDAKSAPRLRQRMGYVIQEGGLFPHLTARQNVTLLAETLGWDAARLGPRLDEVATLAHLPQALFDRYPYELSGGQRQRVSLMRALFLEPALLLLDEPLGALDPVIRRELSKELREVFRAVGTTVVLVTHDVGEAAYFGHELVLLSQGRVLQQGVARDFADAPRTPDVARFVGASRGFHEILAQGDMP